MQHVMPMVCLIVCALFTSFLFTSANAVGTIRPNDEQISPWLNFTELTTTQNYPDFAGHNVTWTYYSGEPGTLKIDQQLPVGQRTLILLEGSSLLAKGMPLPQGQEMDALDYPLANLDLITQIMMQAIPEGPRAANNITPIILGDAATPLAVETSSGGALYSPPWLIIGTVSPVNDQLIYYQFKLRYLNPRSQQPVDIDLYGHWHFTGEKWQLPAQLSLDDWHIYQLQVTREMKKGQQVVDYQAVPVN